MIKLVANQFQLQGLIEENTLDSLLDYLQRKDVQNNPICLIYLGDYYYYGFVIQENKTQGIKLYEKALELATDLDETNHFYFNSLCILGNAYLTGEDGKVAINYEKSETFLKKASEFQIDDKLLDGVTFYLENIRENQK